MAFKIRPLREFLVRPSLPEPLARMSELASNLVYTWDPVIRSLFYRLDKDLWHSSSRNGVYMLGQVSQDVLKKSAADPRFLALYRRACKRYDEYMNERGALAQEGLVAFFSMEYGLVDCLPNYSGGLGLLAGDFLKAASDLNLPVVGVGLLYQRGFLQQSLNPDGWQQERYPTNDFHTLPVSPVTDENDMDIKVSVDLPTGKVHLKVWRMDVGRTRLFLLDSRIPENDLPENRDICGQLYGGDVHTRMRQEIVLGIGGMRALRALSFEPTVYHLNEGHSAFLALERIRLLMTEHGLQFEEALQATRSNNVFTTHTSVPAGIDLFDRAVMEEYFREYCQQSGIPFGKLMGLGQRDPQDVSERFSMPILAIKTSSYRNAVSLLHRQISQAMWQDLWPRLPVPEIPITSITNGVHLPTWLSTDMAALYDQYLQPEWRERSEDEETWHLVADIPDQELFDAHQRRKHRLVNFVRQHQSECAARRKAPLSEMRRAAEVLDPNVFTIGFARRFTTYKRATLLFRDADRLKRILTNPEMPVQIVIAGKAHPSDNPGKTLIREIVRLSRDPGLSKRLVFVEDYGISVAREMVRSVDLWLNTPRRGDEACGTSGMKAGINGVLNLSILDGWFDEAYETSGGWAIGDREAYSEDQDEVHARAVYSLLENEIVPMYYGHQHREVPREWMLRVKRSIMSLSPRFNSKRMVRGYMSELYQPSHAALEDIQRNGFERARELVRWDQSVRKVWEQVAFIDVGPPPEGDVVAGRAISIRATLQLAGLEPKDVRVEAVIGRVGANGDLEDTEVTTLPPAEQRGSTCVFEKAVIPSQTGRIGYALRISPNHHEDPLTRPCSSLLKWGMDSTGAT